MQFYWVAKCELIWILNGFLKLFVSIRILFLQLGISRRTFVKSALRLLLVWLFFPKINDGSAFSWIALLIVTWFVIILPDLLILLLLWPSLVLLDLMILSLLSFLSGTLFVMWFALMTFLIFLRSLSFSLLFFFSNLAFGVALLFSLYFYLRLLDVLLVSEAIILNKWTLGVLILASFNQRSILLIWISGSSEWAWFLGSISEANGVELLGQLSHQDLLGYPVLLNVLPQQLLNYASNFCRQEQVWE